MSESIFSSTNIENQLRVLCQIMDISNRSGVLCGQGPDQIFGRAYDEFKTILVDEFGGDIADKILGDDTFCVSSFDGQVLVAIRGVLADEQKRRPVKCVIQMPNDSDESGIEWRQSVTFEFAANRGEIMRAGVDSDNGIVIMVDLGHEYVVSSYESGESSWIQGHYFSDYRQARNYFSKRIAKPVERFLTF